MADNLWKPGIGIILLILLAPLLLIPPALAEDDNTTSNETYSYINVREVRFNCKNMWGSPIPNVTVDATAYESTMPDPIAWLLALFGVNTSTIPVTDPMNGTTGYDGSISFIMVPAYKYDMNFTHEDYETVRLGIWPTEDDYLITMWPAESASSATTINGTLYYEEVSETQVALKLDWTDTASATEELWFFVRNSTGCEHYTQHFTSCGNQSCSYTVSKTDDTLWYWGYNATHSYFPDTVFEETNYFRFEEALVPIEIDGEEISDLYYNWICIALIVLVAGLFSKYNVRWGAIIVPLWADLLKLMFKFNYVPWIYLAIATVLGFMYFIRKGREVQRV